MNLCETHHPKSQNREPRRTHDANKPNTATIMKRNTNPLTEKKSNRNGKPTYKTEWK